MNINKKIGIAIILLAVAMFVLGMSLFSYQGPALNPVISKIGMWSFLLWIPTIILGAILIFIGKSKK